MPQNVKFRAYAHATKFDATLASKQHKELAAGKNRAMKIQKKQVEQIRISLRVSPELHAELIAAAKYNGRFLNDEIVERVKAAPIVELLHEMARENAELKAMIKDMHRIATEK